MSGTEYRIEIQPNIPPRLARLAELANDLRFSWDRPTRGLFVRLDRALWEAAGHNPKVFLRRVDERRLRDASTDAVYLDSLDRVLARYDTYLKEPPASPQSLLMRGELIAYFSAEFGFHESFTNYSGGLGILAGDHCKAASDLGLPFVGVGLLYRQGYFNQAIDADGNQLASYHPADFGDLPLVPATGSDGSEIRVRLEMTGRPVVLRVWEVRAGRVRVIFLDSDLAGNDQLDREITYQLYGGDLVTRIKQEMALGIGGVRALRAIGLNPTVWHINEGHASFSVLERCRELVSGGIDFSAALEACAASTVFTTHTPVPAGHDVFPEDVVDEYLGPIYAQLGLDRGTFMSTARKPDEGGGFNQTALAIRGSRFQNGVSRIHGEVSAQLCASLWPQVPPHENPITYVTNGVHVGTFLAREWIDIFDSYLGGEWRNQLSSREFWTRLDLIPDHLFWSLRQILKGRLLRDVRDRLTTQALRNGYSNAQLERIVRFLDPRSPDVLTVGFARRFATYKRATLLFADAERLARIVGDEERRIVFMFAGKAHPADHPAQELIRTIHRFSREPRFEGRVLLVEGYDMALARRMVAGVDVWLNNPAYPLEACGTSGQKAGMNGVINLSVLDGWWGEGFDGENGWAIRPFTGDHDRGRRDIEESASLYELLERHVVPLYYDRNIHGYSKGWVEKAKRSMMTLLPHFSAARMVEEYVEKLYHPAASWGRRFAQRSHQPAVELARWKARVRGAWSGVALRRLDQPASALSFGERTRMEVAAELNGLSPDDVRVECLFGQRAHPFVADGPLDGGHEHRYVLDLAPDACGLVSYRIRAYPRHELLVHPHETGLMIWL